MSDPLHQVLKALGSVKSRLENIQDRNDEDRKDAGRHREWQRAQNNEMRGEIRSIGDRVTHYTPIVDGLHKKDLEKQIKRDLFRKALRGAGRYVVHLLAIFASTMMWFFGMFEKFGKMIAAIH